MSITLKSIDPVTATITIVMKQEEYQPLVEKALTDIRKKAVVAGFRKGNVPKSRIQALYGQSMMVEELNKAVTNQLSDYIKEQSLVLLGEPIPAKEQQPVMPDYDHPQDYEFSFDVGITPKLDVKLTKADRFPYYIIQVSEDMVNDEIESYKSAFGVHYPVEVVESGDVVKGVAVEQDGELKNENASLMPSYIKNQDEQTKWIGAKVGDIITFNPSVAYAGNVGEVASFLGVKREEAGAHTGDFTFTIREILRYKPAELGQELYDKVYGPGIVTSEQELRTKVKDSIATQLAPNSDYRFGIEVKKMLEDRAENVLFPDDFLKRWLIMSDSKNTAEAVEAEYPKIISDVKQRLIHQQLLEEYKIETSQEEVEQRAYYEGRMRLARHYGMIDVPDDVVGKFVQEMFKDEKNVNELVNQILESKLIVVLKEQVTLQQQEISLDDYKKLFQK
jgi:trigger factor